MVEHRRIELRRQRSCKDHPLTQSVPRIGAWSWLRSSLSAFSARRFHQISFPSMVRTPGIEPGPERWQRSTQTTTPRPQFGGSRAESNTVPPRDRVYSATKGPPFLTCGSHGFGCRGRSCTGCLHGMNVARWTVSLPCENGGAPTCRSPCLAALTRFERGPEAAPVDAPRWRKAAVPIRKPLGSGRLPTGAGRPAGSLSILAESGRNRSPCPKAPSAFKAAPRTLAVRSPLLVAPAGLEPASF